jgi:hypothetical protein
VKRIEEQPIEGQRHHLRQQGDPVGKVQVVRVHGKAVEIGERLLHPPDPPQVRERVHLVAEEVRAEPLDERVAERDK